MRKMTWLWVVVFLCMMLLASACSSKNNEGSNSQTDAPPATNNTEEENSPAPAPTPPKPVTLTYSVASSGWTYEAFMDLHGKYIEKRFPHVTMKFFGPHQTGEGNWLLIKDYIAAGEVIDIMYDGQSTFNESITDNGLQFDHSALIKKYNVDLTKYEPNSIEVIKMLSGGEIHALPLLVYHLKIAYNMDLFDKFGVDYPKNGMTWDELYDTAKKMTRTEDGIDYRGFTLGFFGVSGANQLSASYVDPATNKVLLGTDNQWRQHLMNFIRFFEIPGSLPTPDAAAEGNMIASFVTDKTAAMSFSTWGVAMLDYDQYQTNFGFINAPYFADHPGVGVQMDTAYVAVTSMSPEKEAAFEVVSWMASDEYQLELSKRGIVPALTDSTVRSAFASDLAYAKGKDLSAFFADNPAKPKMITPYDVYGGIEMLTAFTSIIRGEADINTALNLAVERLEQKVAELQASK